MFNEKGAKMVNDRRLRSCTRKSQEEKTQEGVQREADGIRRDLQLPKGQE